MEVSQNDIRQLKTEVGTLSKKLNEVHYALVGNDMTKDGGLIQRVINCEREVEMMNDRIKAAEKKSETAELHVKIIWLLGGSTVALVFAYVLKLIFH